MPQSISSLIGPSFLLKVMVPNERTINYQYVGYILNSLVYKRDCDKDNILRLTLKWQTSLQLRFYELKQNESNTK